MNGFTLAPPTRSGSLQRPFPRYGRYGVCARAVAMAAVLAAGSFISSALAATDSAVAPAEQSGSASSGAAAPILSPTYKLGPDDQLSVRIARHPDFDTDALILSDGTIALPRIGRLAVSGMTLQQAQDLIGEKYKVVLVHPDVTVSVHAPRVQQAQVFGAVNEPGPVEWKEGWHVTDALAKAGGLKLRPSWVTMTLTRRQGSMQQLDPDAILSHPDSPANVAIQPGDTLIIQEIPTQPIFVSGEVMKPGMYDLREVDAKRGAIGVLEALTLAGGATPKASLSKAYILRANRSGGASAVTTDTAITTPAAGAGGAAFNSIAPSAATTGPAVGGTVSPDAVTDRRQEPVDLSALQRMSGHGAGPGGPPEVLLYPGDTLQIPAGTAQIVVMGHVNHPGAFPIPEDRPTYLADALAMAGGPDERAKTSKIGVIRRPDPSQASPAAPGQASPAKPKVIEANLSALLNKSDLKQDVALQPGDVVYVSETSKPDWFHKVIPSLSAFTNLLFFTKYY